MASQVLAELTRLAAAQKKHHGLTINKVKRLRFSAMHAVSCFGARKGETHGKNSVTASSI